MDSLKGRRPIIINLEKLETEVARKIFDFMSGATYALNGNVQKVANNIFIFGERTLEAQKNPACLCWYSAYKEAVCKDLQ